MGNWKKTTGKLVALALDLVDNTPEGPINRGAQNVLDATAELLCSSTKHLCPDVYIVDGDPLAPDDDDEYDDVVAVPVGGLDWEHVKEVAVKHVSRNRNAIAFMENLIARADAKLRAASDMEPAGSAPADPQDDASADEQQADDPQELEAVKDRLRALGYL